MNNIEHKVLAWNVVKVQPGTYRDVRKHKFIVTMEEQDVNEFRYRVLAEERADILNHKDGKKEN